MKAFQFQFASVSKSYGSCPALVDVTFTIRSGEHTALLGPSGCGKTTLLRLLVGLEPPTSGEILLDGNVVSRPDRIRVPPHLRGVAMVFQDLALWPNLTVMANVLLGLAGNQLPKRDSHARAHDALVLCGIGDLGSRKPGQLSGGQQQRAALARAMAVRPRLLVLDEPFAGIDVLTKIRLLDEIRSLAARQELTILLVSHDPAEALMLCQTALVLRQGQIEEAGPLADLLSNPRSELLRAYREHFPKLQAANAFPPA